MAAAPAEIRVAVIGAGWAGIAAAVEAVRRGHAVTMFEMAAQPGGRARAVDHGGISLDNGQHILIGAYTQTLALLRTVGVDVARAFVRTPLRITYPAGHGLRLNPGSPAVAFAAGVMRQSHWRPRDRIDLLRAASGWALRRFRCDPSLTVAGLTERLSPAVRADLIDPLCVAALNTPAGDAAASVFLRVLKDALFSGPGSADLLLPTTSLSALLPEPALRWLSDRGADIRLSCRIGSIATQGGAWLLDGAPFDRVVLAATPVEAARLTASVAPKWSHVAASLRHEPIVTVYLHCPGARLPEPMLALRGDDGEPAQFVFDRGRLGGPEGLLAFVISGAQACVDRGMDVTARSVIDQARATLHAHLREPLQLVRTLTEKRATFRCTPNLVRPSMHVAAGLHAAGDHVEGPYPATLEGAVRSGHQAAASFS